MGGFSAAQFQIAVTLTNHGPASLTVTVQADFYDAPADQLGDDPAVHLVTAGTMKTALGAGKTTSLLINAKNVANQAVVSVGFRAVCAGSPVSFSCGENDPFQAP